MSNYGSKGSTALSATVDATRTVRKWRTLVALDVESRQDRPVLDIGPLIEWLAAEGVSFTHEQSWTGPDGQVQHQVTFDAGRVRYTHVHGKACALGFVSVIAAEVIR